MAASHLSDLQNQPKKREVVDKRKFHPDKFVHSSLFSEVYVLKDLPIEQENIWENYKPTGYFEFFDRLLLIMNSFGPQDAEKWTHSQTNENLIYPMLEALGWGNIKSKNNSYLENFNATIIDVEGNTVNLRPSLLICEDERGKNFIKNSTPESSRNEFKRYLNVPVVTSYYSSCHDRRAAKYNLKKDEIGKRGDVYSNLGPDNQVLEYLNVFDVPWGIFTDGSTWRLYRKEISSDGEKFLEFDFSELYNLFRTSPVEAKSEEGEFFEIAKYLYWFFSKESLFDAKPAVPFIETLYKRSQEYVERIKEDLKEKYVHAMTIACNGYLKDIRNKRKDADIKIIAKTAESFIFNLIFIRSCESKRILPMHQNYLPSSLKVLVDKIKHFSATVPWETTGDIVKQSLASLFGSRIDDDGYEIYKHLQRLHNVIEKGDNGLKVVGFVETVFYPDEKEIYQKYSIRNKDMVNLIYQLFYEYVDNKNIQIPYSLITPRQLGSIYESFLEFQPEFAKMNMSYLKKKTCWQWVSDSSLPKKNKKVSTSVSENEIIFTPNNKERKTTGSYFTPDYIVNYIVKESLSSLCSGKTVDQILAQKICDPAMGSGHFLLGALDFLSKKIAEKEKKKTFTDIKRAVLVSCLYGADINPSAVKLSKMSLWIATAMPGKELENVDDQVVVANTLVKSSKEIWQSEIKFNAVIGNPPYISMKKFPKSLEMQIHKKYCLEKFKTYSAKSDYFCCFIERAIGDNALLVDGGYLGMILSQTFLLESSFSDLRSLLYEKSIKSIITVKADAFEGVGVKAASVVLRNCSPKSEHDFEFKTEIAGNEIISVNRLMQEEFSKINLLPKNAEPQTVDLLRKIGFFNNVQNIFPLEAFMSHSGRDGGTRDGFLCGISTGDNDFWLSPSNCSKKMAENYFKKSGHKAINLEKYYNGSTINRYFIKWDGTWINWLPDQMIKHKSTARPGSYHYDDAHIFYKPKDYIVNSLVTPHRIVCTLDTEGHYWDINVNIIIPNKRIDKYSLVAILNSKLVGWFVLDNIRSNLSVSQGHLRRLPIKVPSIELAKKIEVLIKRITQYKHEGKLTNPIDKEMDVLIYKLYGLETSEIEYVESVCQKNQEEMLNIAKIDLDEID